METVQGGQTPQPGLRPDSSPERENEKDAAGANPSVSASR